MAENLTGEIISFGTPDHRNIIGVIQSEVSRESAEVAEARNEEGKVFASTARSAATASPGNRTFLFFSMILWDSCEVFKKIKEATAKMHFQIFEEF